MSEAQDPRGRTVIVTGASSGIDAATARACMPPALSRHERIGGLVNNAGASLHDQATEQLDLGEFRRVLDLNVVSVIRLV